MNNCSVTVTNWLSILWANYYINWLRSVTRSLAVAERPRDVRIIEYFAKSLSVTWGHSKCHQSINRVLLAFCSNDGPILYHFRDKARYWSKVAIFFKSHLHSTPLGGSPSEYCHKIWSAKLEWCLYRWLLVLIQYRNVTDRRPAGQTPHDSIGCPNASKCSSFYQSPMTIVLVLQCTCSWEMQQHSWNCTITHSLHMN